MRFFEKQNNSDLDEIGREEYPFLKDGDRVDLSDLPFRTLSDPLYWLKHNRFDREQER